MNHHFFANLHLDTELQGSSLEGGDPRATAAFLLEMAEQFEAGEAALPASLKKALTDIQNDPLDTADAIQALSPVFAVLKKQKEKDYHPDPTPAKVKEGILAHFDKTYPCTGFAETILDLSDGESVTVSGGYSGVAGASGHAVLYRFSKADGEILIDVFNTGDGITEHFSADTQPADWFQTQGVYRLKNKKELAGILREMAVAQVLPRLPGADDSKEMRKAFKYSMENVYGALNQFCTKIKKDDDLLVSRSFVGQQSGTCSARVFTPLIHALVPDKMQRDRFRVFYKFESICQFHEAISKKGTRDDWELLSSAIKKLMRVIHKKMPADERKRHSAVIKKLYDMHSAVKKRCCAFRMPVVPVDNEHKPGGDKKKKDYVWVRYEKVIPWQPTGHMEEKADCPGDFSDSGIKEWIKGSVRDSQIDVDIFYAVFSQILQAERHTSFEKRCALENTVRLLNQANIQINISNVNDRAKLLILFQETEDCLEAFKALSIQSSGHHIPGSADTFQVTAMLARITREATQQALSDAPPPPWAAVGPYEIVKDSAGFMEKVEIDDCLRADAYRRFNVAVDKKDQGSFYAAMENEIFTNAYFLTMYTQIKKNKHIEKKDFFNKIIEKEFDHMRVGWACGDWKDKNKLNEADMGSFRTFVETRSLFGLYSRGGHLIRDLRSIDCHSKKELYSHRYSNQSGTRLYDCYDWTFADSDITLKSSGDKTNITALLNRSRLATAKEADSIPSFLLLSRLGRSLSLWPDYLVQGAYRMHKWYSPRNYGGYSYGTDVSVKIETDVRMILTEEKILEEFIKSNGEQAESIFLELGFAESGLKFYNALDYYARWPDKLTDRYSQVVLMMGLFGSAAKDLTLLDEKHFAILKSILEYNIKLFVTDQAPEHGVFLLELLSQLRECDFHHPWLDGKISRLLPLVLDATGNHPELHKRALFTQLIQKMLDFNESWREANNPEDTVRTLCDIILLNKQQQDLSPEHNYSTFAKAGALCFRAVSAHYPLLAANADIAAQYLAEKLWPDMGAEERLSAAKSMTFDGFPDISVALKGERMLFNIAGGEMVNADGNTLLTGIPEKYLTDAFGPEHSHTVLAENLKRLKDPAFAFESVRCNGAERTVLAGTSDGNATFSFQRTNAGKPVAFLTTKERKTFQKIDVGSIGDKFIGDFITENPHASVWYSDRNFMVLDENLQVFLTGELGVENKVYVMDKQTGKASHRLILPHIEQWQGDHWHEKPNDWLMDHARHFAGDDFRLYQSIPENRHRLVLSGYGISFDENKNGGLVFSANPDLVLEKKERMNFAGSMTLSDSENKKYILIPDLPFVSAGKDGYFGRYLPDYSLASCQAIRGESPAKFQEYAGRRAYYQFSLDDDGNPEPKNAREKLFLCYYYMNCRQYEDAFAAIQSLRREETTDAVFPTLELLHRIIMESPKPLSDDDKIPFNESILAIKTQALLIAANMKVSKKIQWPESEPDSFTEYVSRPAVREFFDNFPNAVCRAEVIHYIRNVSQSVFPESMRVKNEELAVLLGLDLTAGLKDSQTVRAWKSCEAVIPQAAAPDICAALDAQSQRLSAVLKDSENFSLACEALCDEEVRGDSPSVLSHKKNLSQEIIIARAIIEKEREDRASLLVSARKLLSDAEKMTALDGTLQDQIHAIGSIEDEKNRLLSVCHAMQKCNTSLLQAIDSGDQAYITADDLVVFYLRRDLDGLARALGTVPDDPLLSEIMQTLENVMKSSVSLDRLKMIQAARDACYLGNDDTLIAFMTALKEQGSEYMLTEKNRELLIFEYAEHMRLRKNQVQSIEHVLAEGHENSCVQFIMGGGKTSVFLPLAAMKNADGDALSMVIVPDALLTVNEKQLDAKTMQLFSAKSQTLHFDRESPATPDDLYRMYNTLLSTQGSRGYVVTSRETLQALELKYIELLGRSADEDVMRAVDQLQKILALFRDKGKAIIDEVDSVLYIRKEFNYSAGDETAIDPVLVNDTLTLYRMIATLPPVKLTRETAAEQMALILTEMLKDTNSFVSGLFDRFQNADIAGYLMGDKVSVDFMSALTSTEKNRLALLKHQLTSLLPSTLLQELNVTYGFSKQRLSSFAAIPYVCNNVPAESSRFSSPYETLNLTIQMHLASPLNAGLLEKMLRRYRIQHFNEGILSGASITLASVEFERLTGLDLDTVYREFLRTGTMDYMTSRLDKNPARAFDVRCELIASDVALEVTHFPEIIKSDTISFVDQLHSSVGISGTVQNHYTYHSRMYLEESLNPDTDGRTLVHLLEKNGSVLNYERDKINPENMLSALQSMLKNLNTRAVIDIGALFTGITGAEVAACLAELLKNMNPDIQYVLYYDPENHLCALPVAGGPALVLEKTDADYLQAVLGCDPSRRFTFYDQSHTTGSDIRQMPDARAVATIGEKTRLRDLVQGVMRMRGFAAAQTVDFFTGNGAGKLPDVESIIKLTRQNQEEELLEDHYRAACKKMSAAVRNRFMDILLHSLPAMFPDDAAKLHEARSLAYEVFKSRLVLLSADPFTQFGRIVTLEEVGPVLENRMQDELAVCEAALLTCNTRLSELSAEDIAIPPILETLKNEMEDTIRQSVPICHPTVVSPVSVVSEQVEVQAQQQMQQQQTEELQQLFGEEPNVKREIFCDWRNGRILNPRTFNLKAFHPAFDENIAVTRNYGYLNPSCSPDRELSYQRANVYCFFARHKETGQLSCTLLTQQEAAQYRTLHNQWETDDSIFWLETPSGMSVLSGQKPADIEKNEAYSRILEQVQFFHGDVDLLLKNPSSSWLGTLAPDEIGRFLNQVMSNPLFRHKKQFYDVHYDEITEYMRTARIQKLILLTAGYLKPLQQEQLQHKPDSAPFKAIQKKVAVLENLMDDLTKKAWSPQQKLEAFNDRIAKPETIQTLSERRYLSRGILHVGGVFLKGLLLCFPALLDIVLNVATFGGARLLAGKFFTEMAMSGLFHVTGKKYLEQAGEKSPGRSV